MGRSLLVAALSAILSACGGGGGGGGATPSNPAPIPSTQTCDLLGGAASTPGVSILNGSVCSPDRSSVVLLRMEQGGQPAGNCTGTIIHPRVVLTAAHCLDEGADRVQVWLGSGDLIVASSFVFFPNYKFNTPGVFDVGVVFLDADLPRNPVPILFSRDARVSESAIIAGWGRDQNNETASLRAASTTISAVGASLIETIFAPPSGSVCQGDSGGPILVNEGGTWTVAGITSATSGSACNTGTNFYQAVRQPSTRDFILQHVPNAAQR